MPSCTLCGRSRRGCCWLWYMDVVVWLDRLHDDLWRPIQTSNSSLHCWQLCWRHHGDWELSHGRLHRYISVMNPSSKWERNTQRQRGRSRGVQRGAPNRGPQTDAVKLPTMYCCTTQFHHVSSFSATDAMAVFRIFTLKFDKLPFPPNCQFVLIVVLLPTAKWFWQPDF